MDSRLNINQYYQAQCQNYSWYNKYFQCGEIGDGSIFKCFSTNYRNLLSFEYYYENFKRYVGVPRNQWDTKETTGQEIAKQYVVNLVESYLYYSTRNSAGELVYNMTSRGEDFGKMLNTDFNSNEKELLLFLFLVNSSFNKTPRYILKRARKVWELWAKSDISEKYIKDSILSFITHEIAEPRVDGIFRYDIVWLLGFYSDENFLRLFNCSNVTEKQQLYDNAVNDYKSKNKNNVLAWKFKSTNFQRPALFDTLIMLYISKSILDMCNTKIGFYDFYNNIINDFNYLLSIDTAKVFAFIAKNENVFEIIFENAISQEDDFTEYYVPTYRHIPNVDNLPTEKIDATSKEGVEKLEVVRQVLKKLAKEKSGYRCALEAINGCSYFTSKEEGKNYLEIHHLVPREFSFDFEDTIEFVDNYVPLCPKCHRMIHKAVDRERKGIITFLFNQRILELKHHNINVDIKTLYEYYRIDKD